MSRLFAPNHMSQEGLFNRVEVYLSTRLPKPLSDQLTRIGEGCYTVATDRLARRVNRILLSAIAAPTEGSKPCVTK